jgi:methionyl-tRNA formyltransferase
MCDDRETGVTVHWIDERVDSGDIVLQKRIALERGRPLVDLYYDLATLGAELLRDAVAMIERGTAPRIPQDEAAATDDPARGKKTWHVDLARWPSERVWHVVRGVTIGTESVLSDSDGRPIAHGPARTYTVTSHARTAGTIESLGSGWRIYCVDGFVDVDPPARRPRTSQRIKKFIRSLLQRPS